MQSTQARNKGCVRSLHMLCDVLHENATTSGARYGLQTVKTCVPISSGPLFMFLSANLLWSAQKSRTFDPFDSKAPRWLPIFSPFGLPMTLAKSRAATNCIPFRPHAEPWRHISWNSMKLHVSTEKRLVYRVYPRLFRVPMCSIPGPCHTTSESSSQSMGKHCSHSCRSGPAKRRSGERDDKYWQISPDKCPEFIGLQTDSDFIGILDLGIRKTWSGIRPSNTFSRDAQRHGRTSKHDKLAQQHTATTNTRSSCGVRAPIWSKNFAFVSKPMTRILTGCGPHIRVFLRVLFFCTASEFSTGPLGSQQFQALIVTWQRDSSSQGQWILPVIDRCAWDRMRPNGTEWDRIWLCCIQVTAGDSILLGHKPWAKISLRDVEWNIVAVRNISYSTVFALASEKVLCIASRALNFCCALHAKNSLDQLWAWHVAWLELVKLLYCVQLISFGSMYADSQTESDRSFTCFF